MLTTELVVHAEGIAKVLRSLSAQSIDAQTAQRWALFVRRGFFERRSPDKCIKPISIDYDDAYEDAIAEAVSRIDEIGDLIDGDVPDETETELLLHFRSDRSGGKFGIWLRGSYALRHLEYSCRYDLSASRCCGCSAGSPCWLAPIVLRMWRS